MESLNQCICDIDRQIAAEIKRLALQRTKSRIESLEHLVAARDSLARVKSARESTAPIKMLLRKA